jgi:hypothetical protein
MNLFRAANTPGQLLDIIDAGWCFHISDGGDLLRIGFDAMMTDDEAE